VKWPILWTADAFQKLLNLIGRARKEIQMIIAPVEEPVIKPLAIWDVAPIMTMFIDRRLSSVRATLADHPQE